MAKVLKQWMEIATLTFGVGPLRDHAHKHKKQTNPGGELICNKLSMCLKCTLPTEGQSVAVLIDSRILKSEWVS